VDEEIKKGASLRLKTVHPKKTGRSCEQWGGYPRNSRGKFRVRSCVWREVKFRTEGPRNTRKDAKRKIGNPQWGGYPRNSRGKFRGRSRV